MSLFLYSKYEVGLQIFNIAILFTINFTSGEFSVRSCLLNVTALFIIKDAALHIKYVAKQSKPHSGHDQSLCQIRKMIRM